MRRPNLTAASAVGLLLVACTGPTTATSLAPTTTVATTTTLLIEEAIAAFRSCLEDRAVVVPDLPIDEAGRPDLGPLATANDISTNTFRTSLTDCATILAANGVLDAGQDDVLAAEVRKQLEEFSECMREAGVEDFPDPVDGFAGQGLPFPSIPIADPELATAIETCSTALGFAPITG